MKATNSHSIISSKGFLVKVGHLVRGTAKWDTFENLHANLSEGFGQGRHRTDAIDKTLSINQNEPPA
jgi:hypothetical protein